MREKRQITLPAEVCQAAGLQVNDMVDWRFENGEIHGRKLIPATEPRRIVAKLVRKGKHLVFELPKGVRIDPDAIGKAVQEERESR
jgi:hypothetical protein